MQNTAIILFLLVSTAVIRAQTGIPEFYLYYANVQQNLFFGEGRDEQLMELDQIAPKRARFLAKFWRTRAMMAAGEYPYKVAQIYMKQVNPGNKDEVEAATNKAREEAAFAQYSYYYDHWSEINEMIDKTLKAVKAEQGAAANP